MVEWVSSAHLRLSIGFESPKALGSSVEGQWALTKEFARPKLEQAELNCSWTELLHHSAHQLTHTAAPLSTVMWPGLWEQAA